MRALTVRQPWASMIATGAKLVENRPRPLGYRGPLAVHAGRGWMAPTGRYRRLVDRTAAAHALPADYPAGVILAVAELVGCHPAEAGCCQPWGFTPRPDAPVHHLVLADVRPVPELVAVRGALGLWTVPAEVAARLPAGR